MKKKWKLLTLMLMLLAFIAPFYQKPNNANANTPSSAVIYESSNYTVLCSVKDTWQSHSKIQVTISNTSDTTIDNWSVIFNLQGEITEIWNAKINAHVGDLYVISNAVYNQDISAYDSITFEFITFSEFDIDLPSEFIVPLKEVSVPTSNYSITVIEKTSWDNNYLGEIIITNLSKDTITDWNLLIDFNTNIHSIWNASIASEQNNLYTIENLNYNQNISPGESVSIGFLGTTKSGDKTIIRQNLTEFTTTKVLDNLIIEADFEGVIPITDNYYISPLYSLSGEVSAYHVQYLDERNFDCSYIIVNNAKCSKNTYYIEFGYGTPSTISKLKNLYFEKTGKNDYRILYLGGSGFYLQDESALYGLSEDNLCELSSSEFPLLFSPDTNTYYNYLDTLTYQEIVAIEVGYSYRNSNLSTISSGIYITTGDASTDITEFTPVDHCAPTSATNLFIYLSSNEYPSLNVTRNNYESTFADLYRAMETNVNKTGTYHTDAATGIEDVLRSRGLSNASVSIHEDVNWYAAMSSIDNRPVYLSLKGSEIYANHAVLGVGYISFSHSTGWVSKYFQIADALEPGYRYVNYSLGIDRIHMLEVSFGGN